MARRNLGLWFLLFGAGFSQITVAKDSSLESTNIVFHVRMDSPRGELVPTQIIKKLAANGFNTSMIRDVTESMRLSYQDHIRHVLKLSLDPDQQSSSGSKDVEDSLKSSGLFVWVERETKPQKGFDPRDITPNDPLISSQYHHKLLGNFDLWDRTIGLPSVTVAIPDDGFELSHPDLSTRSRLNQKEIEGNGIDDDANGYIDDYLGWDLCSNNADPTPESSYDSHGTHVAGIVAADADNAVGTAGVAPGTKFLPIQIYGGTCDYTPELVGKAFVYAADRGAKILTLSYNTDPLVESLVFQEAIDYADSRGVLMFGSAGNAGSLNPKRTMNDKMLFVAATNATDQVASFSNYGSGVDFAAPGDKVLSTVTDGKWEEKSGTSMASPNAAAVAALAWSLHPQESKDQIACRLSSTAVKLPTSGTKYEDRIGHGRVSSIELLGRSFVPAPRLHKIFGIPSTPVSSNTAITIKVRFDQILSPSSVNAPHMFKLERISSDGQITNVDLASISTYAIGTNDLSIQLLPLESGDYRFVVSKTIKNPFGTSLDTNEQQTTLQGDLSFSFKVED